MLKKMMLLAGMALALVAFAGTASASAASWVHWTTIEGVEEHTTIEAFEEDFTGFAQFAAEAAPANNFGCVVHAHLVASTVNGEAHGEITSFEVTTETCKGEGAFAACKLKADSSTVPWTVDVNTSDLTITGVGITNQYEGEKCPFTGSSLSFPEITATPDPEATRINCLTLEGKGLNGGIAPVVASGELCAYNEGTYGIE
jgi:hypothetical protein